MARMFPLAWAVAIALFATLSTWRRVVAQEFCLELELSDPCLPVGTVGLVPDSKGLIACRAVPAVCFTGFPECAPQACQGYIESEEAQMVLEYEDVSEVSLEFTALPVDVVVEYGDGTVAAYTGTGTFDYAYSAQGNYRVMISGNLGGIRFKDGLTAVVSWGELGLTTLEGAFSSVSVQSVPADLPPTVTNLDGMFRSSSFNGEIGAWDVSSVTNMGNMFRGATSFNQDISGWDVSSVTDMGNMFSGASAFNQDISGWDVSKVSTCGYFSLSSALKCVFWPPGNCESIECYSGPCGNCQPCDPYYPFDNRYPNYPCEPYYPCDPIAFDPYQALYPCDPY
ncbi:hypothetical protein FVE85_8912 [Porphyridium purpureum]|uniref:BspA family leucine-rich repeat surface protein n=1 Tax=Porphyridium purpureum TaxID=35688 RepID=A0A5J4YGK7_PORPP|nr:hypothetical protein FVE85_8912 [Porphyridium purpureum]|eukprot:POR7465..scf276_29